MARKVENADAIIDMLNGDGYNLIKDISKYLGMKSIN